MAEGGIKVGVNGFNGITEVHGLLVGFKGFAWLTTLQHSSQTQQKSEEEDSS
jgi:hypothetical protein